MHVVLIDVCMLNGHCFNKNRQDINSQESLLPPRCPFPKQEYRTNILISIFNRSGIWLHVPRTNRVRLWPTVTYNSL